MKEKTIKILLVMVLSIVCMELDAQTVIREKVKIKPSTKLLSQLSVTEGYSPIEIHASGARSFTIQVSGPGGGGGASNNGSGSQPSLISVGAVNGIYQITVENGWDCNTNVSVWVTWLDPQGSTCLIGSYELWFYGPRKSSVSFSFGGIPEDPPPTVFNYTVDITEGILCGERASDVFASPNCDIDSLPNKNIQLSIASNGPDCVLFDKISNQIAGTTVTTTFDKVNDYGIKLNSPYRGTQTQVKLLAYSNGIEQADSIFVNPAETEYYLDADNYLINLIHGMAATLKVKLLPGTECSDTRLAPGLLLNIEITSGDSLGHLIDPQTGAAGRLFTGLSLTNGELAFDFIADGSKPDGEDTVYVSVTPNNPNIWQYDFIILINEGKIVVQFVPGRIAPGGTADIVLKKKEADGTLSSFPPDQSFNLSLVKGKDFGTINYLYRGTWPDTTDNVEFSSEPFKFTSRVNLTNTPVQSAITVSTYLDSGERIWGGAAINIGEDTQVDTFYVKASFDKENFSAGDTLSVSFVKVDKNGNVSNFPAGTLYEVRVDEGCTVGELLIAGARGSYFKDVSMPIQFVVNDSLGVGDTLISVKVGVPNEEGTVYLNYTNASTVTAIDGVNYKIIGKAKSVAGATSACAGSGFVYTVNANAVAEAGGEDCNDPKNWCKSNEPQQTPQLLFKEITTGKLCLEQGPTYGALVFNYTYDPKYCDPIASYKVELCYNEKLKQWIISLDNDNSIIIQYELDWCMNKINERWSNPINSLSDIKNIITDEICVALEDILKQQSLDVFPSKYVLSEVIKEHEIQHKRDFVKMIPQSFRLSHFSDKFSLIKKSCEDFKNIVLLEKEVKKTIDEYLKEFVKTQEILQTLEWGNLYAFGIPDDLRRQYENKTESIAFFNYGRKYAKALIRKGIAAKLDCIKKYSNNENYQWLFL